VYLWPAAISMGIQRRFSLVTKIALIVLSLAVGLTVAGIFAGGMQLLMASTALFVV
jgi:uncharacterized membrane protein